VSVSVSACLSVCVSVSVSACVCVYVSVSISACVCVSVCISTCRRSSLVYLLPDHSQSTRFGKRPRSLLVDLARNEIPGGLKTAKEVEEEEVYCMPSSALNIYVVLRRLTFSYQATDISLDNT